MKTPVEEESPMLRLVPVLMLAILLASASAAPALEGREDAAEGPAPGARATEGLAIGGATGGLMTGGLITGVDALRAETLMRLADLPERKLSEIRRAPRRFIETAADLIYGFGEAGGLGVDGLDRFIAIARAQVRAREMRRLLLADLNDDGQVSRAEITLLIDAEAATSRGRLELAFREADGAVTGVQDGMVGFAEMRAFASAVAREDLDETDARLIRSILMFDLDGDGAVTLDEIIAGIDALTGQG